MPIIMRSIWSSSTWSTRNEGGNDSNDDGWGCLVGRAPSSWLSPGLLSATASLLVRCLKEPAPPPPPPPKGPLSTASEAETRSRAAMCARAWSCWARGRSAASASSPVASGRPSTSLKVVPALAPDDSSSKVHASPCSASSCLTIVSPRPVPPLPCSWPLPTCENGSPLRSTSSSGALMPTPWSTTSSTSASVSACDPAFRWRRLARTATAPPGSVNLIALLSPFTRHC
mmetsp:Transcript_21134/g.54497  ORF Transcript_21134/g.54497 Transcript_21134/m.54497 type:complete len:229 (+) Transcript_21134:549-1235(+)